MEMSLGLKLQVNKTKKCVEEDSFDENNNKIDRKSRVENSLKDKQDQQVPNLLDESDNKSVKTSPNSSPKSASPIKRIKDADDALNITDPHDKLNKTTDEPLDNLSESFLAVNQYDEIVNELVKETEFKFKTRSKKKFIKGSLQNFKLVGCLGSGSFGVVFLIKYDKKESLNALKCVKTNHATNGDIIRYAQEKEVLLSIQHPNICQFYASFKAKNHLQLVMEYCPAGTLQHLIRNRCLKERIGFKLNAIKIILLQILMALHYLHECKIAHRDIKPHNIGISGTGYLKLCDFGASKKFENFSHSQYGTFGYEAPEVNGATMYDHRCDIFSFGRCVNDLLQNFQLETPNQKAHVQDLYNMRDEALLDMNYRPHARVLIKHVTFNGLDRTKLLKQEYDMKHEIDFDLKAFQDFFLNDTVNFYALDVLNKVHEDTVVADDLNKNYKIETPIDPLSQLNLNMTTRRVAYTKIKHCLVNNTMNSIKLKYRDTKIKAGSFQGYRIIGASKITEARSTFLVYYQSKTYVLKLLNKNNLNELNSKLKERDFILVLNHPNIVKFYDTFEAKNHFQLLYEYVQCETLQRFIENYAIYPHKTKFMQFRALKFIILQILITLDYLYNCGISYENLNANHILMTEKGYIKFCKLDSVEMFSLDSRKLGSYRPCDMGWDVQRKYKKNIDSIADIMKRLTPYEEKKYPTYHQNFTALKKFEEQLLTIREVAQSFDDLIMDLFFSDIDLKELLLQKYDMYREFGFKPDPFSNSRAFYEKCYDIMSNYNTLMDDIKINDAYDS